MRAAVIRGFEGPAGLTVEDLPDRPTGVGELTIAVEAVSINRSLDLAVTSGLWPALPPLPHVPGIDPTGRIVEIGREVDGWRIGDRIAFASIRCGECPPCSVGLTEDCLRTAMLGVARWGGFATRCTAPASAARRVEDHVRPSDAAFATRHGGLARHMILRRLGLGPGDRLLVTGASGALGQAAMQIATACGIEVVAAAGTSDRARSAQANAEQRTLAYANLSDLEGRMHGVVETTGVPAVWESALGALARGGRLVGSAGGPGARASIGLMRLYTGRLTISGATLGRVEDEEEALALAAAGKLRAPIAARFPLERIGEAFAMAATRNVVGKIIIEPWSGQ